MDKMKLKIISLFVAALLKNVNKKEIQIWLKSGIELLKKKIKESESQYDDITLLPILDLLEHFIEDEK